MARRILALALVCMLPGCMTSWLVSEARGENKRYRETSSVGVHVLSASREGDEVAVCIAVSDPPGAEPKPYTIVAAQHPARWFVFDGAETGCHARAAEVPVVELAPGAPRLPAGVDEAIYSMHEGDAWSVGWSSRTPDGVRVEPFNVATTDILCTSEAKPYLYALVPVTVVVETPVAIVWFGLFALACGNGCK